MNTYPRLVSWNYYPASRYIKNDKEQLYEIYLNKPEGESVLANGKLPSLEFLNKRDPYFTIKKTDGKTLRARNHGDLGYKFKKKYPELENKLKNTNTMLMEFGEYIFIKLAYIDNYVNPIVDEEKWFNSQYIKKEYFNVEFIKMLLEYEPLALIGHRVIKQYQAEKIPTFLRALSIFDKDLYEESIKGTKFEKHTISYKGLKAKLQTLSPGLVEYRIDIGHEPCHWDGELLTRQKKLSDGSELIVNPTDAVIVKIVDNATVNMDTELID